MVTGLTFWSKNDNLNCSLIFNTSKGVLDMLRVIELARFGKPKSTYLMKSSDWLYQILGSFPAVISLAPADQYFPRINDWRMPIYSPKRHGVVWYEGEVFLDFKGVDERLTSDGFGPDRRTELHRIITQVVPRCDYLWRHGCPLCVVASSVLSFWQTSGDYCYLPGVFLVPKDKTIITRSVTSDFDERVGFLVELE